MAFRTRSNVLALSLFLTLTTIAVSAQAAGKPGSKYDVTKETKLKGTITQVIEGAGTTDPTILTLKSGDKVISVELAPKDYLKEIECWVKVGDVVEVTGAKVADAGDQIIAREVVLGNSTMVLRDNKGVPVWELWKPSKGG
jgi:hypothetical protein